MSPATAARLRDVAPIVTLVLLVLLIGAVAPGFLAPETLLVLASDTATLFIMAAGVTFLILLGGIVIALALAFGLGGRDRAAALLERWFPADRGRGDKA